MKKNYNIQNFKEGAARASIFLDSKGHKVPKATLLHALSHFIDGKDWNTINSMLKEGLSTESISSTNEQVNKSTINSKSLERIESADKIISSNKVYQIYKNIIDHIKFLERRKNSNKDEALFIEKEIEIFQKMCVCMKTDDSFFTDLKYIDVINKAKNNKEKHINKIRYDFSFHKHLEIDTFTINILGFLKYSCGLDFDVYRKDRMLLDHNKNEKRDAFIYEICFSLSLENVSLIDSIFKTLCWRILI